MHQIQKDGFVRQFMLLNTYRSLHLLEKNTQANAYPAMHTTCTQILPQAFFRAHFILAQIGMGGGGFPLFTFACLHAL